jgi:hypothetical protein
VGEIKRQGSPSLPLDFLDYPTTNINTNLQQHQQQPDKSLSKQICLAAETRAVIAAVAAPARREAARVENVRIK